MTQEIIFDIEELDTKEAKEVFTSKQITDIRAIMRYGIATLTKTTPTKNSVKASVRCRKTNTSTAYEIVIAF